MYTARSIVVRSGVHLAWCYVINMAVKISLFLGMQSVYIIIQYYNRVQTLFTQNRIPSHIAVHV